MPPPPPPCPPPPPGPPPPPTFGGSKGSSKGSSKGGADDRNALLSSIRQGAKLKKTVTVDKSGPFVSGKVSNASSGSTPIGNDVKSRPANTGMQNGGGAPAGLGGLFAGGMPKLRPTGKLAGATPNGQIPKEAPRYTPPQQQQPKKSSPDKPRPFNNNHSSNVGSKSALFSEMPSKDILREAPREPPSRSVVRRQPSEVKTRGPPPQPPVQKAAMPSSPSDSILTTGSISDRINILQQRRSDQSLQPNVSSTVQRNKSSLHSSGQGSLGGSMSSLSSVPSTPTPSASLSASDLSERPKVSHGKPNLAPKPPTMAPAVSNDTRPSPPPKKLIINGKSATRTQSMRMPRSPSGSPPSPPEGGLPLQLPPAPHHLPPGLHHLPIATKNPASHFGTMRAPRGLRPPGVCPPPPPGAPPPPPARHGSLGVHPAPPPPPHHRQNSVVSQNGDDVPAPPPPVRGSSMRAVDFEARFGDLFNPPTGFPPPDPFLRFAKDYSSATVGVTKAQAPPPPLKVPLDGWSGTSSAC